METFYLDTHIVIWLREKAISKLSGRVIKMIESADKLLVSPMVILELEYLFELGRITDKTDTIISDLGRMIGLNVDKTCFYDVVKTAQKLNWTHDAFDRLIVAQAEYNNSKLITKDKKILEHSKVAVF